MSLKTRGLLWVALAGLLFVVFIALVRYIGNELHPIQAAFLRYLFCVPGHPNRSAGCSTTSKPMAGWYRLHINLCIALIAHQV
ncbi:MAG: hypothetical protein QGI17_07650, partial [Arenicellales bacterium]|nr:hypothetical protein [Arenicellales bacterium]